MWIKSWKNQETKENGKKENFQSKKELKFNLNILFVIMYVVPLFFLDQFTTSIVADHEREFYTFHERYRPDTLALLEHAHDIRNNSLKNVVLFGNSRFVFAKKKQETLTSKITFQMF